MIISAGLLACALLQTPIGFESPKGLVVIPVQVSEKRTVLAIVDTGAGTSVIDSKVVQELNLKAGETVSAKGIGGSVKTAFIDNLVVQGKGVPKTKLHAVSVPLAGIQASLKTKIELILGYDFLKNLTIDIDYEKKTVAFLDEWSSPEKPGIPFSIEGGLPLVDATINVSGKAIGPFRTLLDSGSTKAFEVSKSVAESYGWNPTEGLQAKTVFGIGGGKRTWKTEVRSFSMSGTEFESPVWISEVNGTTGRLGAEVFSKFHTVFDYKKQQLFLFPRSH